jgi:hypothetical protein
MPVIEPSPDPSAARTGPTAFALLALAVVLGPLVWRPILAVFGPDATALRPSSLPVLEAARERYPFNAAPLDALRSTRPEIIIMGDSMSDRIETGRLTELTGRRTESMMRLATGSAHWYLIFKNHVVASGIPPGQVLFFFRDTQLTDPLYRITGRFRYSTDEFALEQEPELNAVVAAHVDNRWFRLHLGFDRLLAIERTRDWLEPGLTNAITRRVAGAEPVDRFTDAMNGLFALDRLRVMTADDMGDVDEAALDFDARVDRSTLPLIIDLADARGFDLVFTRVLRRPDDQGRLPRESAALRRYVQRLRGYVTGRGARYFDDREDAAFAQIAYADGDHIAEEERGRYTTLFANRLAAARP